MRLLFVADALESLKPAGDSSLAMARAAMKRGHEVLWATDSDLAYALDGVVVRARRLVPEKGDMPSSTSAGTLRVRDLQGVFIRKDPPFDQSYVRVCWLLALEEERVVQFNRASLLLRYHEKLLPLEGLAQGMLAPSDLIPTFIGAHPEAEKYFEANHTAQVVTKPFLGFGGRDVVLQKTEAYRGKGATLGDCFIQPFADEVLSSGDRRVIFLDGKAIGNFVRMPAKGGFVSNLAQGGSALSVPMSADELKLCDKVGKLLKALHIDFAGADFIGPKVSEINITSPTGLRQVESLEKTDPASLVIEAWEKRISRK